MATAVDQALSAPCLRDFAQRCRRLAEWERDPRLRRLLVQRAQDYERLAAQAFAPKAANDRDGVNPAPRA